MKRRKAIVAAGVLLFSSVTAVLGTPAAQALDNGVARTPSMGWNSWNTFGCDINETQDARQFAAWGVDCLGIRHIVNVTVPLAGYAAPGGFNDPDMMEVGRGGMTDTEMRSHFALWAMLAAPLIAGNDIRSMNTATQTILKNQDLIAVNQDGLGQQATQVSNDGTRRVLAERLADGDVAVALFDQGSGTTTVSTTAAAVGKSGNSFTLREAWTGATSSSTGAISASVPGHGTVVYRVSGGGTTPPPSGTDLVSAASGRGLDVPDGATANGTQPVIWDCNGGANQRWSR
ncbi:RICIN domain-containing protein [Actinoplanes sp. NBRC 103695]|uniref:RICIN domain-containing protein n=1 Tax=Actinoplanes sp. NBRC 103695 TaxID=3032202 RepID=UPI0024A00B1D|nr:RICIN domain-containing protein [Actinoplanes sp. NBRC 103695]GLY99599.1 hypothetical protein Acsp02_68520 [Actinoplanes sp. NBRC 103695]